MEKFKNYIKFFKWFLIFYVIVSFGFILFFAGKDFYKIILYLSGFYFIIGILIWILFLSLDSLRLLILAKGINKHLNIKMGIEFITSGSFFALVTPFGSGGLPYQIWLLSRYNFSIVQTLSLIVARGICIFTPYLLLLPFVINTIKTGFSRIFLFYAFLVAIVFFLILILKKDYRAYLKSIKLKFLIISILISFPIQLIYLSFLYISLKSFSINIDFFDAILRQVIMQLSTYFQITPGGLGISELISSIIISENIELKYVGFVIVLWRFFSGYLNGFLGFYFVIKKLK